MIKKMMNKVRKFCIRKDDDIQNIPKVKGGQFHLKKVVDKFYSDYFIVFAKT